MKQTKENGKTETLNLSIMTVEQLRTRFFESRDRNHQNAAKEIVEELLRRDPTYSELNFSFTHNREWWNKIAAMCPTTPNKPAASPDLAKKNPVPSAQPPQIEKPKPPLPNQDPPRRNRWEGYKVSVVAEMGGAPVHDNGEKSPLTTVEPMPQGIPHLGTEYHDWEKFQ